MNNTMTEWEAISIKLEHSIWRPKAVSIAFTVLALLDKKGISKQELAAKMNVKPQYVSRIVKGKANLTLETLVKIEQALESTIVDIIDPTETVSYHYHHFINNNWTDWFSSENSTETSAIMVASDAYFSPYLIHAA